MAESKHNDQCEHRKLFFKLKKSQDKTWVINNSYY